MFHRSACIWMITLGQSRSRDVFNLKFEPAIKDRVITMLGRYLVQSVRNAGSGSG
jgi:hypothetical protein